MFRALEGLSTGEQELLKTGREGNNGLRDDVGGCLPQPAGLGTWAFSCRLWEPRSIHKGQWRLPARARPGKQGTAWFLFWLHSPCARVCPLGSVSSTTLKSPRDHLGATLCQRPAGGFRLNTPRHSSPWSWERMALEESVRGEDKKPLPPERRGPCSPRAP